MKKILIISPHMDDEVLGTGGTICHHIENKDHVTVLIVANRAYNHQYDSVSIEEEKGACKAAKKILGYQELIFLDLPDEQLDDKVIHIIRPLEAVVAQIKPDIVYIPHRGDNNQDHRAIFEASRVVLRPSTGFAPKTIRIFEVPSSTEISPPIVEWAFSPNMHVDITNFIDKKISAMCCYEKESRDYPHPRSPKALEALAMKRGIEVGLNMAEGFITIRQVLD